MATPFLPVRVRDSLAAYIITRNMHVSNMYLSIYIYIYIDIDIDI